MAAQGRGSNQDLYEPIWIAECKACVIWSRLQCPKWLHCLTADLRCKICGTSELASILANGTPTSLVPAGVGKGSYFAARACAGNSDRLAACIVNPPPTNAYSSLTDYYQPVFTQKFYDPLSYAQQYNASVLPANVSNGYVNASDIFNTMLTRCNASSPAPELFAQAYEMPTSFTTYSDGT